MNPDDPHDWADRLKKAIREQSIRITDRVEVLAETDSTQEAAFTLARGLPGLMVIAVRQSAGRGRLGRRWDQRGDLGLALTLVLDATRFTVGSLSLAAGLAAARAIDHHEQPFPEFGLRWPNDVVEPVPRPGGGRKVAGVLIEVRDGLALVGIGVNILQQDTDFPPELLGAAVSLRQLGSDTPRIQVAERLVLELQQALGLRASELAQAWAQRDVLVGSTQVFLHDGKLVQGVVESIDPTHEIRLRTGPDAVVRLPAASTSLVRD